MLSFSMLGPGFQNEIQLPGIGRVFKYLRDRGVLTEDIDHLGIKIELASTITGKKDNRAAIIFPHQDLTGRVMDWWSARLVELEDRPKIITSFAQLTAPKGKMYCPPKEPPMGYLPATLRWGEYKKGDKVYIHESAIKAINGAKLGTWSIGLNGVWGWRSEKHQIALVREIKDIPWKALSLQPVIVFDSNAADNAQVQGAISALAAKIHSICGVRAKHILLPKKPDGEHWGFDDFVVYHGREKALAYLEQDGEEVQIGELEMMKLRLNAEVCVVESICRIAEIETGTLMSRGSFVDVNYADYVIYDDDTGKQIKVPVSWLADERRTTVQNIVYEPGMPKIFDGDLNLWKGMGCDPAPGDVKLWLDLLSNNVPDEAMRKWVLQWLAYPLQNPGKKTASCTLIFGPAGTGKDIFLRPFSRIYGPNHVLMSNDELKSTFTSLYAAKQFVHVNEVAKSAESGRVQQKIKMIVTGETLVVNRKGDPEYAVRNVVNLALTSNYPDCVRLDADDRRVAVLEWSPRISHKNEQAYWAGLVNWIDAEGSAAIYDYLLGLDLSDFDPMGWAPETDAKEEVKESGVTSVESWARRVAKDPDEMLPELSKGKALYSSKELAGLYYDNKTIDDISKRMVDDVGYAVRAAGLQKANSGKPIRVADHIDRYWIVRRKGENWSDPAKCAQNLKLK